MQKSGEFDTTHEVVSLLTQLVELRNDTYISLKKAERQKNRGQYNARGHVPAEQEFNDLLDVLLLNYYNKFEKGSVDIPEDIEDQLEETMPEVDSLSSFKDKKKLFHRINKLMEDLGHTSFEIEKRKDKGYGEGGDEKE